MRDLDLLPNNSFRMSERSFFWMRTTGQAGPWNNKGGEALRGTALCVVPRASIPFGARLALSATEAQSRIP